MFLGGCGWFKNLHQNVILPGKSILLVNFGKNFNVGNQENVALGFVRGAGTGGAGSAIAPPIFAILV